LLQCFIITFFCLLSTDGECKVYPFHIGENIYQRRDNLRHQCRLIPFVLLFLSCLFLLVQSLFSFFSRDIYLVSISLHLILIRIYMSTSRFASAIGNNILTRIWK
jgi:hypothetical protein